MAASEEGTPVAEVAVTVLVTLIIYWLAERWSFLLGSHLTGEPITFARARHVFAEGWSMVQASYTPLIVMLVGSVVGLSEDTAVNLALASTIVVLIGLGVIAGHRAGLSRWGQVGSAAFTGLLGVVIVLLKAILAH